MGFFRDNGYGVEYGFTDSQRQFGLAPCRPILFGHGRHPFGRQPPLGIDRSAFRTAYAP